MGCLYCKRSGRKSKEHLIPSALGANEIVRSGIEICERCNNGIISTLDKELCTKSFLAVIASRELGKDLFNLWAVVDSAGPLFIEAYPVWDGSAFRRFVPFPQIVFSGSKPTFFVDGKVAHSHDTSDCIRLLTRLARNQFEQYKKGVGRACHFERISKSLFKQNCEYPPRVFFRKTFDELAIQKRIGRKPTSLIIRYVADPDLREVMRKIDSLELSCKSSNRWDECRQSALNRVGIDYDVGAAFRALLKISIHLVHHISCVNDISSGEYDFLRKFIIGDYPLREKHFWGQGFIQKSLLSSIFEDKEKVHQFLIQNDNGEWTVISSFFSQSIGTCIRFRGVNRDSWKSAIVQIGYGDNRSKTEIQRSVILMPTANIRGSWVGSREFLPDFPWITNELSSSIEMHVRSRKTINGPP
jgi:hypothetical protein